LLLTILGAIVFGTLVTLFWGLWRFAVAKSEISLTLNSVGHVNHSAIYLAIVFGVALSFSIAYWRQLGIFEKAGAGLSTLIFAFSVFLASSRAAVIAAVMAALALSLASAVRKTKRLGLSLLLVTFGATVLLVANPAILEKTANQIAGGAAFAFRGDDWKNALVEWRQFPLFGVGMGNFGRPTLSELREWNATQDWAIRPSPAGLYGHGHSLYLNTLAERGLVGSAILLAVLIGWGVALVRATPSAQDPPIGWTLYGGALSAWVITVLAGLLNTTLHHEHGLLSGLLLGLWLGCRKQSTVPRRSAALL
jgi:O-antigen ligase